MAGRRSPDRPDGRDPHPHHAGYGGINRINTEHDAVPERTTVSPGETRSEAEVLHGAVVTMAEARETELLEIDRGWEGTAGGGIVSLQRWRVADQPGDPAGQGQRHHFWDVFQTMIHEYLHTLTHERYYDYARTLPGHQAMELITIIGPRNVFAANLLGEIDMIRASPVASP